MMIDVLVLFCRLDILEFFLIAYSSPQVFSLPLSLSIG